MNTCIMCNKEVHADDGYVTDGKIFVCRKCAEINSLRTITVRIANMCVDTDIQYVWEAPIEVESGLVDQTGSSRVELGNPVLDDAMAIMAGDFPKAELIPAEEYNEELFNDIDVLSEEDFRSKYSNDPYAIDAWYDNHVYQTGKV